MAALSIATTGCATANLSPELAPFGAGQVNPAGANTLLRFDSPKVAAADLAAQVCPTSASAYRNWSGPGDPLADALACFDREAATPASRRALAMRRNAVLGYLLLRSDQACALWVTYLERAGAVNRGAFNIAGVVTGGVGALVSGDASRILSGASGIASGSGAAIDAALLHGLTEGLILPRVAQVRRTRRDAITDQLGRDVATYPVSLAIADALDYHAACNVASAIQADTPGAQFGRELDYLVTNAARVTTARAALTGGHAPTAADVQAGSVFLSRSAEVLLVKTVPAAATGDQTVSYEVVGTTTKRTAANPQAFLDAVRGGLVLRTP